MSIFLINSSRDRILVEGFFAFTSSVALAAGSLFATAALAAYAPRQALAGKIAEHKAAVDALAKNAEGH